MKVIFPLFLLAACASTPEIKNVPLSESSAKDCEEIAIFLGGEAVRTTDLSVVREKARKLLAKNRSISMQACPAYATLEHLADQIGARFPHDPAWAAEHSNVEKLTAAFSEKNEGFRWQLPGDKKAGSRATFLKRLATTSDRAKRQSIYKLFASSRSRRWVNWGWKDLILARNAEAKAAGYSNYLEYILRRNGQNYSETMKLLESIRDRLGPLARKKMRVLAESSGISSLEPWDIYYLMDKAWGQSPAKPVTNAMAVDYAKIFLNGLALSDLNPANISVDNPVVKTDLGQVVGQAAVENYSKYIKQPIVIFQRPSESSREAVFESMKFLALDSPLLIPTLQKTVGATEGVALKPQGYTAFAWNAYRYAWLFAFETAMYEKPEADFFELWSDISYEFWGVEVSTFYGGFDEDEYLKAPASFAEKALGAVAGVGIVEGGYRQFSQNLGPGFGERLKAEWFASGSEKPTFEMLRKFSNESWTAKNLLELLASNLQS